LPSPHEKKEWLAKSENNHILIFCGKRMETKVKRSEYLIFSLAQARCAMPIPNIIEIVQPDINKRPLDKTQGEIMYNGKKVPLVFPGNEVLDDKYKDMEDYRIIIAKVNGKTFGVVVDRVDELLYASDDEISTLKDRPNNLETLCVERVISTEDGPIYILRADQILKLKSQKPV
jgi:chemotaxis signal transduction protein